MNREDKSYKDYDEGIPLKTDIRVLTRQISVTKNFISLNSIEYSPESNPQEESKTQL